MDANFVVVTFLSFVFLISFIFGAKGRTDFAENFIHACNKLLLIVVKTLLVSPFDIA